MKSAFPVDGIQPEMGDRVRASMIAHGIRNPLNAMAGALEYLRMKYTEDPALTEFEKLMQKEISRFDNFISQFLSASMAQDKHTLLDVNSLIRNLRIITSFQAEVKKIRTEFAYGDIPKVRADAFHLGHAVLNIINNAFNAMTEGGQLRIRTALKKDARSAHHWVVIEIADTGPGLALKNYESSPRETGKGKGFGLFITHEVLRCCGGKIELKTGKDYGTVVRLFLPVKEGVKSCKQKQ